MVMYYSEQEGPQNTQKNASETSSLNEVNNPFMLVMFSSFCISMEVSILYLQPPITNSNVIHFD